MFISSYFLLLSLIARTISPTRLRFRFRFLWITKKEGKKGRPALRIEQQMNSTLRWFSHGFARQISPACFLMTGLFFHGLKSTVQRFHHLFLYAKGFSRVFLVLVLWRISWVIKIQRTINLSKKRNMQWKNRTVIINCMAIVVWPKSESYRTHFCDLGKWEYTKIKRWDGPRRIPNAAQQRRSESNPLITWTSLEARGENSQQT
jgi:hypothetical protein